MEKEIEHSLNGKTVLVIGLSKDPQKESHKVAKYLQENGYKIIPVNPTAEKILEETVFPSLERVPNSEKQKIDVINVFRPSEETEAIVDQAIRRFGEEKTKPVIWLQLGIKNDNAKQKAMKAGFGFVEDRCIKIEHKKRRGTLN
ncbi:MAG: CoA-binding protein [Candidatus Diapherotrites archaeon]|uniref:CoA-binding protein n=1 Tax=Candidatus Iainarchaeum sp. TaxID=3101447 RepID=A0A8T4L4Z7_9ARCH|nr:CoA-binding protein [Candidatus Diapherotrites archaeon]